MRKFLLRTLAASLMLIAAFLVTQALPSVAEEAPGIVFSAGEVAHAEALQDVTIETGDFTDYFASPAGLLILVTMIVQALKKMIGTTGWATKILAMITSVGVAYGSGLLNVGYLADATTVHILLSGFFIGLAAMGLADLNKTKWIQGFLKTKFGGAG